MKRGPIYQQDYKPQFSGHETFPLRYGWLKKAYDRVSETENEPNNKASCWGDNAIAHFGVGKNMVSSIRHWATVTDIIEESPGENTVSTTQLGQMLFSDKGLDPYMEHLASLWLIHWKLATEWKKKTTWFWAFNYYPAVIFEREKLVKRLEHLAKDNHWPQTAHMTLKSDVACFIRTYAAMPFSGKVKPDNALESPLTELGLIKSVSKHDRFRFVRGPKSTLGNGIFVFALLDFWSRFSSTSAATLSFEAIAYEPGAPGRTFLLDENDIVARLTTIAEITDGALQWSETAGLKQVVRNHDFTADEILKFIALDYSSTKRRKAA